ncbi:MAG TPA: DUF262 domain-containing protein [Kiritimatiellia bacterium]|nr:DUF262 domain-containing protein [Kiritimatiellia bacterium]
MAKKTDLPVKDLVGMIERSELQLPEMQRRYVWRAPRVRDLLDSLYRGYPSGSILVWETDQPQPTQEFAVEQQQNPFSGRKLLLDGQQRLTSLFALLRGRPVKVRGRKREIEILFNLEHPETLAEFTEVVGDEESPLVDEDEADERVDEEEEMTLQERLKNMTFVVASKALEQQKTWVSVSKVFRSQNDLEILEPLGIESLRDPRYVKYSERLKKLRNIADYPYAMYVLSRDLSYEEVAEIFVRVNSLGVKLRGSDLALAQITARWRNSLKELEKFQEECEEVWMTLDLGLLVRAMVVFATGQARFGKVASLSVPKLKDGWEKAKNGLKYAINFLRTNADIEDETLLSSPLFFITIAYYSQIHGDEMAAEDEKTLLYWLYVANARGRYSRGSSETILDQDLSVIRNGGSPEDLLGLVKQQFGRLAVEPTDLAGRGAGSPLFSLVFLALKAGGAKDWKTGLELSLSHQGRQHYIQYHHIFPKSLLKEKYDKQEINEIANMAFISGKTNRRISNQSPSEYLPGVIAERGEEALTKQGIPLDPTLFEIDNYRKFLETRRQILADIVNRFIEAART